MPDGTGDLTGLARLLPRQPLRVLEDLAGLSSRVRAGEPLVWPRLTLHLSGGHNFRGQLLGLNDDAPNRVALLLLESDDRFACDVTHVALDHLEAVTVHDALRIEQPISEIIVGKLSVRRAVLALGERLNGAGAGFVLEIADPATDHPEIDHLETVNFEPIMTALLPLESALLEILNDDLGRQALKNVAVIKLSLGDTAQVLKSGATLELQVARGFVGRPSVMVWRELLERSL